MGVNSRKHKDGSVVYFASIGIDGDTVCLGNCESKEIAQKEYELATKMRKEGATREEIWVLIAGPKNKPEGQR